MAWSDESKKSQAWEAQFALWQAVSDNWDSLLSSDNWVEESNATEQKGNMLDDTLKTTLIGGSSAGVILTGWLPDAVAVAVGILTALHLAIKIVKEFNK